MRPGSAPSVGFGHAFADEIANATLEVKRELVVDVSFDSAARDAEKAARLGHAVCLPGVSPGRSRSDGVASTDFITSLHLAQVRPLHLRPGHCMYQFENTASVRHHGRPYT